LNDVLGDVAVVRTDIEHGAISVKENGFSLIHQLTVCLLR